MIEYENKSTHKSALEWKPKGFYIKIMLKDYIKYVENIVKK